MFLERLLQINVAMLAVTASVVLALPQRAVVWPAVILVAAIAAVALTDVAGKIRLPQLAANVAVALVFVATVPRMIQFDRTAIISAVGDLLMGSQIPVFFQQKHPRMYMQLIMLSFLQVVVASVMSQGTPFGLLLTFYLFTAISALTLLHLHRERLCYQGVTLPPETPAGGARWPLSRRRPAFASLTIGRAVVQRELFWRMARMGAATLVAAALVFFATPRLGGDAWRGTGGARLAVVGFSKKIRLGELGRVMEDRAEVLRIAFRNRQTDAPYRVEGSVYLRGAVVDRYEDGQWEAVPYQGPTRITPFFTPALFDKFAPVEQSVWIEPTQDNEFFCVWPFYVAEEPQRFGERLRYDREHRRLNRAPAAARSREPFQLCCGAFQGGRQADITPNQESMTTPWAPDSSLLQMPREPSGDPLPTLRALAAEWLRDVPAGTKAAIERARMLERRLRDSGKFRYSLKPQVRQFGVDPIEDFVSNTPAGHCEYFAGALALMLRSQRIPARIVLGYRTEDWNDVGECFRVRQLNAHAWVEAFLGNDQLPEPLATEARRRRWSGAWLRLDATPAADEDADGSFWNSRLGKGLDWLDFAWRNYFVEMDRLRQRDAVYSPAVEQLRQFAEKLSDPQWWRALAADVAALFGGGDPERPWFSWRAFVAAVAIGLGVLALAALARRLVRRWLNRAEERRRRRRGRLGVEVEFYRRMESLLARARLVRPPSMTQRAFATEAGAELARRAADPQLAAAALAVAEAFYRVRFAGEALDKPQSDSVEQGLARLERAIRKR